MRLITQRVLVGLSSLSCLIHGRDRCCPQVVGMQKGTGERAHPIILEKKPKANAASAA
jgi:hypothetical protein